MHLTADCFLYIAYFTVVLLDVMSASGTIPYCFSPI